MDNSKRNGTAVRSSGFKGQTEPMNSIQAEKMRKQNQKAENNSSEGESASHSHSKNTGSSAK